MAHPESTTTLETGKRPWPQDLEPFARPLVFRFLWGRIQVIRCDTNLRAWPAFSYRDRWANHTISMRGIEPSRILSHKDLKPTVLQGHPRASLSLSPRSDRSHRLTVKPNPEEIGNRGLLG